MKAFHVIAGLPFSGSTVLCDILAQNPDFHVCHTSPLVDLVNNAGATLTNSPDFKGMIHHDNDNHTRAWDTLYGMVESFGHPTKVCFDKNRFWASQQFLLAALFPLAKIIITVRDLRDVADSMEYQWRKDPLLHQPPGLTIRQRLSNAFSDNGLIGGPLEWIEDLELGGAKNVFALKYEDLVDKPEIVLQGLYAFIGEPYFAHDFKKIKSTATDLDAIYNHAFSHKTRPKLAVAKRDPVLHDKLRGEIQQQYGLFQQTFNYR